MFDIHSHILPAVDDGAQNIEESLAILEMMKAQGINYVMATPHFYPHEDNLNEYKEKTTRAFEELQKAVKGKDLPEIYLGCEMLCYDSMGYSEALLGLTLNKSMYLLIELTDECIGNSLFSNIELLKENFGIIPIIAHVERYYRSKNYRKLIKFIKSEKILVQVNASAFCDKTYDRVLSKLIKSEVDILIGTDAHSVEERPPMMDKAFEAITKKYGNSVRVKILKTQKKVFENILVDGEN